VVRQGDWISYTAPDGFSNEDAFTYTISDGRGQPVTGTVNVKITPGTLPSPNLTAFDLGNGSYRIRFDGIPGFTYRIEYTQNLEPADWKTLGSETANQVGLFEIVDTPPQGAGPRFYRSAFP
jgi:hypothetical protein